jgi:hypothetical protein
MFRLLTAEPVHVTADLPRAGRVPAARRRWRTICRRRSTR